MRINLNKQDTQEQLLQLCEVLGMSPTQVVIELINNQSTAQNRDASKDNDNTERTFNIKLL